MKNYVLITAKQWKEYQEQKKNGSTYRPTYLNPYTIIEFSKLRPFFSWLGYSFLSP